MKKSEIVERIKAQNAESPIELEYESGVRKITDPSEKQVNKAFSKICDIWNSTLSSRNFLKHLIQSFLPIEGLHRVVEFSTEDIENNRNRCCILGIKLAGLTELTDKLSEFEAFRKEIESAAETENREVSSKEKTKINRKFFELPVEIQNGTQAVITEKSHKYMSIEAAIALKSFVEKAIEEGDKEIKFTASPKRPKKKFQGQSHKHKVELSNFLDAESLEKLRNLKK